jgi:DsbC/DsbD-like thiol-disulfide interchange protein
MIRTLALCCCLAAPAHAQGTTQSDVLAGAFRPGWQIGAGHHMAALELQLAPQWKTYWRSPGDAGIPPEFDWAGSRNVASVRFHWPAPSVFHTNGMQSIGYHDGLVLPIEVVAIDPSAPIRLRARIDLGVCKDICMPASLDLVADLAVPGQADPVIDAALRAQPVTARAAGVGRVACAVEPIRDGLRLTAEVDVAAQGRSEAVAVEPGLPDVWASEATVSREGGRLTAVVDLVPPSGAPFALDRSGIVLTVIGPAGRAVEITGCPAP